MAHMARFGGNTHYVHHSLNTMFNGMDRLFHSKHLGDCIARPGLHKTMGPVSAHRTQIVVMKQLAKRRRNQTIPWMYCNGDDPFVLEMDGTIDSD